MSGWGDAEWGLSEWGFGDDEEVVVSPFVLQSVNVLAADLIELVFNSPAKINDVLRDPTSYVITPFDSTKAIPVDVREVRPGSTVGTTTILLVTTSPTLGAVYDVAITGNLRSLDNEGLSGFTGQFITRRTKVDSLLSTRPPLYDTAPQAIFRNLINAIGREDDRIGGEQHEGEDIIR